MNVNSQYRNAIVLLIKQIFDQIDEIASLKKQGYKAKISQQLLNEMCTILPELDAEQKEIYFDIFIKLSQHADSGIKPTYSEDYAQHAANSKRRLIYQIRNDLKLSVNS